MPQVSAEGRLPFKRVLKVYCCLEQKYARSEISRGAVYPLVDLDLPGPLTGPAELSVTG